MKYYILKTLAISFLSILMFACDDDDSEPVVTNDPLIGTWKWTINQRLDCGQDTGTFNIYDCSSFCYEVEFKANGLLTVTVQEDGQTITGDGTYTLNGDQFTLCVVDQGAEYCESGEITIMDNKFEWFLPKESEDVCDVIRVFERK